MRRAAGFLVLLLCLYWTGAQGESGGLTENNAEILGVKATSPDIWAELKELRDMVITHSIELRISKSNMEKLEQENTDLKARLNTGEKVVDELKRENTERTKVAFFVGLGNPVGPINAETTIKFGDVFTNIGQAYSPDTGVFTAPVRGTYYIRFRVHEMGHGCDPQVSLYHNDKRITVARDKVPSGGYYAEASNGVVLQLEKGDEIYLVLKENYCVDGNAEYPSTFSGFLLFAE